MTHYHHLQMVCNFSEAHVFCGLCFSLVWKDFKRQEKQLSLCKCQSWTLLDSRVQVFWPGGGFHVSLKATEDVSKAGAAADRDTGRVWTQGFLHNLNVVSATDTSQTHRDVTFRLFILLVLFSSPLWTSILYLREN